MFIDASRTPFIFLNSLYAIRNDNFNELYLSRLLYIDINHLNGKLGRSMIYQTAYTVI